jgi:biopolymer transport protein ExbB/TolQ
VHDGDHPPAGKRTPYIALLSNIATLLGLLGTIMGLIEAFTAVANANPAEMASVKALNSISNSSKRQFPAGALDG